LDSKATNLETKIKTILTVDKWISLKKKTTTNVNLASCEHFTGQITLIRRYTVQQFSVDQNEGQPV